MMTTKVRFTLPASNVMDGSECILVGEFNNWNPEEGIALQWKEDGSLQAEIELPAGKEYQYRYLLSNGRWVNDNSEKVMAEFYGYPVENCMVRIPEADARPVEKKIRKAKAVSKPKNEIAKDDLSKIEGIGKKIALLLNRNGILTHKQLSKTSIKKLKEILAAAGSRFNIHDPASWPKQARLAADEKWEELEGLQKELKGGK